MFPIANPWKMVEAVPPCLMHALALDGTGKRRLTLAAIVARSGLTERTYLRTARRPNWDDVKWKVIMAMIKGTGVDPLNNRRKRQLIRKHGFKIPHLTAAQQKNLDAILAKKAEANSCQRMSAG